MGLRHVVSQVLVGNNREMIYKTQKYKGTVLHTGVLHLLGYKKYIRFAIALNRGKLHDVDGSALLHSLKRLSYADFT